MSNFSLIGEDKVGHVYAICFFERGGATNDHTDDEIIGVFKHDGINYVGIRGCVLVNEYAFFYKGPALRVNNLGALDSLPLLKSQFYDNTSDDIEVYPSKEAKNQLNVYSFVFINFL